MLLKQSINNMHNAEPTSNRYRNYVLGMLTVVYALNFIDRQLLVILQESIKAELHLSDTQLGLLSGFTFAIFYVTLGIPIARIADRGNRRNVVAVSLTLWSLMTALSGMVQNFIQLLLARIGVGVGEAGGSPPAHAMISDYFPKEQRGRALAIYSTGIYIGILFGFVVGGYLDGEFGWRMSFIIVGLPGVLVAGVLYATVKEPKRGAVDTHVSLSTESVTLMTVARVLFAKKSFVLLAFGTGLHAFAAYGTGNWFPSLLFRVHDLSSAQVGTSLGLVMGLGGILGTYLSGVFSDRLGKNDPRWYFWIPAIGAFLAIPFSLVSYFSNDIVVVLTFLTLTYISYGMFLAPALAITHNMVKPNMRAFSSAVLFFILNIIGLGIGPLTVGFLSDLLTPSYGEMAIRWALPVTTLALMCAVILFTRASRYVKRDLSEEVH